MKTYVRRVTVTSKVHDTMLFEESENIYITVVDPILNICPGECVFTSNVTLPDSSTAIGSVQDTAVPESELSAISEVISYDGQCSIVGAAVSFSEMDMIYILVYETEMPLVVKLRMIRYNEKEGKG